MEMPEMEKNRLPWNAYNEHFKIIKIIDDHLTFLKYEVKCLHCIRSKSLTADTRSPSNLKKHLTTQHNHISLKPDDHDVSVFSNDLADVCSSTTQNETNETIQTNNLKRSNVQLTLQESLTMRKKKLNVESKINTTQAELDGMIQKLIINRCLPFSLVEYPEFKSILQIGFPKLNTLSRPTLMKRIDSNTNSMLENLKKELSLVKHISTTADCWSIFKKSYLGITGHWLNKNDLTRISCLLAMRRLKGKHSFDVLAKSMESVYTEFDINHKITYSTTDNGSNFVKSFKVYNKNDEQNISNLDSYVNNIIDIFDNDSNDEFELQVRTTIDEDNLQGDDDDDESISVIPVFETLEENDLNFDTDVQYSLPKHHRCAAHTLNLIATKDAESALHNNLFKKQSRATFGKLQILFNKQSRSTQIADIINDYIGVYLKIPNTTRWNSHFDAMKFLLKHRKSSPTKFNAMCDDLKIVRINTNDVDFIEEYCTVMEPLAISLDILQGENNMYFGYLLPTINELLSKLETIRRKEIVYCQPLVTALYDGVNKRFGALQENNFLIIASVSNPSFKTAWIKNEVKKNFAISLLKDAMYEINSDQVDNVVGELNNEKPSSSDSDQDDKNDSFFSWASKKKSQNVIIENEMADFLNKSPTKKIIVLNNTPILKKVFIKYNTPLPSSAPIERVFSIGACVLTKKRGKMSDSNFEKTMLLKSNVKFYKD